MQKHPRKMYILQMAGTQCSEPGATTPCGQDGGCLAYRKEPGGDKRDSRIQGNQEAIKEITKCVQLVKIL